MHKRAATAWRRLLEAAEPLICSNYVLVEAFALIQNRFGIQAIRSFQDDVVPVLEVLWVDETVHDAAVTALLTAGRRALSLVDCTSFELMRRNGLTRVFAFDRDFADQGFASIA